MTVNRELRIKWDEKGSLDLDFEKLPDIIKSLQDKLKVYGPDARIELRGELYSNSDRLCPYVMVPRLENDKEYGARIKAEEASHAAQEAQDKKEFKRLAKKFKDGV